MVENAVIKTIDHLRERGGLPGTDVANVADVSKATVSRWTTGKAALLLEFEGLIIPSAWYDGLNIVVFLVVLTLDCLTVIGEGQPVN